MNGWTPGRSNWKMTKEEDGSFSYTIEASLLEQTFEYNMLMQHLGIMKKSLMETVKLKLVQMQKS